MLLCRFNQAIELVVVWTQPALEQIMQLGLNAKKEAEGRIKKYAEKYVPHATTARVRLVSYAS